MASRDAHHEEDTDSEPEMLAEEDALEEIEEGGDNDVEMGSGDEEDEELALVNDSIAYFDAHKDSVFAIAQHPRFPSLVATGGSEDEAADAPGQGFIFDTSAAASRPVLPASYSNDPSQPRENTQLQPLFSLDGHTDSINALTFTLPDGQFLLSGGLDGRLRAFAVAAAPPAPPRFRFLAEAQEVPEVNWLAACPAPAYPNTVALGASDGSVWVYTVDAADAANPLQIVQSYFLHTAPCTAGAWTPDGNLLATVSEDSSLHVWDVWGAAAAQGAAGENGQTVVSLLGEDARFGVEGGLFSVAINPAGTVLAAGGAGGAIKVVGLPRLSDPAASSSAAGASRPGAGRPRQAEPAAAAGAILASLHVQSDGVETLAFAPYPVPLLAAGSVDGSVAVYDGSRSFAVRRNIPAAHDGLSVVRVEWVHDATVAGRGWLLTTCGMDGAVRRWDVRAAETTGAPGAGPGPAALVKEWRGHRGGGEGGGVLGFVQGETGERVVTAGDDGVVLVFEA